LNHNEGESIMEAWIKAEGGEDSHATSRFIKDAGPSGVGLATTRCGKKIDWWTADMVDADLPTCKRCRELLPNREPAEWTYLWNAEGLPEDGRYVKCLWNGIVGTCIGFFGAVHWRPKELAMWHYYQKPAGAVGGPDRWAYCPPGYKPTGL